MKKFIAAFLLVFLASSSFDIFAQKVRRTSNLTVKTFPAQELKTIEAFSDGNGVLLKWQSETETDLIGFNIYHTNGKETVRVNKDLILSSMLRNGQSFGNTADYNFFDEKGGFQGSYYIEAVFSNDKRNLSKPILPRYTYDLVNVSALSSEGFRQSNLSAQPVIETTRLGLPDTSKSVTESSESFADSNKQKWVAAQPGVKIAIKQEGFYRVTRAELEAAGFNVNSNSDQWQLYLDGEEQAIIVQETGQYIEFYGANFSGTRESDKQIYFLVVGPAQGKRIDTKLARRISGSVVANNFYQIQTKKERRFYVSNIRNGENQNFFGTFISSTPATVTFNLKAIDYNVSNTEIKLVTQGVSLTPHSTMVKVNGEVMGTFGGANHESMTFVFGIPTLLLHEGENTIEFTALSSSSDYSLFDSISVNVARKYLADQNQLSFYSQNYKTSTIDGFTSPNIRVFDITYAGNPSILTGFKIAGNAGLYSVNIPSNRQKTLYAVADDAVKQVDTITQNNPSTLSTTAHNGKLIIISHKNWLGEANNWANYRRADGFTVEVIDVEDLFDEFNYGKSSAQSITDFAQYAKNNWQTPPSYIFLMGDATYDPLNYTGGGNFNFVPAKMVDTVYSETASDDALTDFNNDGLAEIPIGRLPVRSGAEITQMLNKVTIFEQSVSQGFDRGATCASDLPQGYDFAALCSRIFNEMPTGINKTYINRGDVNAQTVLLDSLNSGKYIVNYSGHGNTSIWASTGFFNNTNALNLNNGNNLSIFTMLTCLNGYFIEPATYSLSENLLRAQNGGAVVAWSSSGLTTPDVQEVMARRFYNQLGVGTLTRIGDLINDSKTVLVGGRDVRLSWVLLGDPTLKVR